MHPTMGGWAGERQEKKGSAILGCMILEDKRVTAVVT